MPTYAGRAFQRDTDGSIGDALQGVTLLFDGPARDLRVTTGPGGTYRAELPPGRYSVTATKEGFESVRTGGVLRDGLQTLNVFLSAAGEPAQAPGLQGRAFERNADGTIGDPLEAVSLAFLRVGFARTVATGTGGAYRAELPPGSYAVSVRKEGFERLRSRVVVQSRMGVFNPFLRAEADEAPLLPDICVYAPGRTGQTRTSEVILPGRSEPVELTYEVYDGVAVLDGGIVLGTVDEIEQELREAKNGRASDAPGETPRSSGGGLVTVSQSLVALRSRDKLWDGGVVPFQFEGTNRLLRDRIQEAMDHISTHTNVEFVPASNVFPDRVVFEFSRDSGASSAELGRKGGRQVIRLNERFDVGGIVHEILHALGVLHEQSRNDRDTFVQINTGNIETDREHNFRKSNAAARDIGAYDYDSVMHYHARAFGREQPPPDRPLVTIQPRDTSVALGRLGSARDAAPFLSAGDIAGLNELYPVRTAFDGGHLWGSGTHATGIAFGDVDGDGIDELVVTRRSGTNGRYFILGNGANPAEPFPTLYTGGRDWGRDYYATCCATGDVDGDGQDEVVIGRRAGENMRFEVVKYTGGQIRQLATGGERWGDSSYTTDVAIGVDRSGVPLIGVARRAGGNSRFFVFAGAAGGFRLLFEGGSDWGGDAYATGIAFGDVDGDGRLELGVARKAGGNARFLIYKDVAGDYTNFQSLHEGGTDWGSGAYATGIAFGDVDGDGRDEVGVTRFARGNGRYFVFDSADRQFRRLHEGGSDWGDDYYATSIAFGDVDGDGRDEMLVGRRAGENGRFFLLDDSRENFLSLSEGGRLWGDGHWTTAVALGNARGAGRDRHLAVARHASANERFLVQEYSP